MNLDLKDYGRLLLRNWIVIVACSLLGILAAGAFSLLMNPTYKSQTQLFVAIQSAGSVAELQQGNTFTQARVQSYVETAKTPAVLQPVIDNLGLEVTPAELAESVSARADLNTVLITISASDLSPVQAAAIAQSVGDSLVEKVAELESPRDGEGSPIKLSVVTPAVAPSQPSSPNASLNLVMGAIMGLAAGLVIALLRSALDTKIHGNADILRITDAPVLGGIAYDQDVEKNPLLTQSGPQSPRAESFRQIRTNLQFANVNSKSKTMLVTSSLPGEGKSTTATNLAIAMAQAGMHVVLVDADLRRPTVADYLGLEGNAGLTTALIGTADIEELIQPWGDDGLYVLTSGRIPPNPSELLGSDAMSRLIERLESTFDAIIIDAPPLIPVTDGSVLAQRVGGVVLVVGAGKAKSQDLQQSLTSLELVGAKVLGVVVNLLPTRGASSYTYSYASYASSREALPEPKRRSTPQPTGSHMKTARRARAHSAVDSTAADHR